MVRSVSFWLSVDDEVAFATDHEDLGHTLSLRTRRRLARATTWALGFIYLLLIAAFWACVVLEWKKDSRKASHVMMGIFVISYLAYSFHDVARQTLQKGPLSKEQLSDVRSRSWDCDCTVEISPDALLHRQSRPEPYGDADPLTWSFPWPEILQIRTNAQYAFLYWFRNRAVIVPRRAFADTKDFDDFVAAAMAWREGRQYPPDSRIQEKSDGIRRTPPA